MISLRKKSSVVLAVFMILMMIATSCSKNEPASTKGDAKGVKVIEDMVGRKVEIPTDVKSVATIGAVPVINGFVMCLGEGSKIVNGLPDFVKMPKWKYQLVFAPELKDKTTLQDVNRGPDIEKILEKKPDLCLTMDKTSAEAMEKKGIKAVVLNWKDVKDVEPLMTLLGDIFNKKDKAKDYVDYFNDTVKKAEALTKDLSDDKRKTAIYTSVKDLKQPHLIAEWWIKAAGGKSVTDNGRKEETFAFSLEQLLQWNPDVMIVSGKGDIKQVQEDARLKELKSVKENKVYATPVGAHVWANRTIEQPLTVLWTLNKLYPEKYSEKELIKDVGDFYKKFFETTLSEEQVKEIISGNNK